MHSRLIPLILARRKRNRRTQSIGITWPKKAEPNERTDWPDKEYTDTMTTNGAGLSYSEILNMCTVVKTCELEVGAMDWNVCTVVKIWEIVGKVKDWNICTVVKICEIEGGFKDWNMCTVVKICENRLELRVAACALWSKYVK